MALCSVVDGIYETLSSLTIGSVARERDASESVRKNRFLQKGESYRKVRKRSCVSDMCLAEGSAHSELSIYLAALLAVAAHGWQMHSSRRYLSIAALYMAECPARARQLFWPGTACS